MHGDGVAELGLAVAFDGGEDFDCGAFGRGGGGGEPGECEEGG